MQKQRLSSVFTTSCQNVKCINNFFSPSYFLPPRSRWTLEWIIDWKAGKWSMAWEKCNCQSSPEPKPDAPSIMCVARSWTAARCRGAAGGMWASTGILECEHFAATELHPVKWKIESGYIWNVCEFGASQVVLAQFVLFLQKELKKKWDERSRRSRQSAGLEAANVFPSQISSSYGFFCKAPRIKKEKKSKEVSLWRQSTGQGWTLPRRLFKASHEIIRRTTISIKFAPFEVFLSPPPPRRQYK